MMRDVHDGEILVPVFSFGGVNLSAIDMQMAVDNLFAAAAKGVGGYLTCCNTHSVVESQRDIRLREILNGARLNLPDGMPTVWIGQLKHQRVGRVDGPGLLLAMLNDPRGRSLRHYFYGGSAPVVARMVERASAILGPEAVAGGYSPPMRQCGEPETSEVIARIAASRPDILWVGLGLPKQEYWMAGHSRLLPTTQMIGVGAAFDWFAGNKRRAPALVQRAGLEWAFRLAVEPKRLWRRYGYVVPRAIVIMLREVLAR